MNENKKEGLKCFQDQRLPLYEKNCEIDLGESDPLYK